MEVEFGKGRGYNWCIDAAGYLIVLERAHTQTNRHGFNSKEAYNIAHNGYETTNK